MVDNAEYSTLAQKPIPRRGGPSAGASVSGGRLIYLLSGDGCSGARPPGKAMTQVVVSDPGPRGEGVIPQGRLGKGCLPRELRIKLYNEVVGLRRRGLTYREVINWVWRRHGVRLSKSHVSYWTRGLHSPLNGRYVPSIEFLKPSTELAYVIGVVLGDGYIDKKKRVVKGYNRIRIGLDVKDKDFADEFARCLGKVLGRSPKKPRIRYQKRYVVEVASKTLYQLLKKPVDLDRLRQYVEHSEECMVAFLRGFFDSEGYVNERGYISIANTDLVLLTYIKDLLERLGIASTGPKLGHPQGRLIFDSLKEKIYTTNKDCYCLRIRAGSNLTFYRKVGFTIQRKRRRLEDYLRRRQAEPPFPLFPF